jgi:tRNA 2-selenouridine synthase
MAETIDITTFFTHHRSKPVLDVRTPSEFDKAHIPGALSLPLFTDAERSIVGTAYHHRGREAALLHGLDLTGPKLRGLVEAANGLIPGREAVVHCWRGGMRSASIAWLLEFAGYSIYTLSGGYKSFRRFALDALARPVPVRLLGGLTGASKTDILQALARNGEQVIDLEDLADHAGSAFGGLGRPDQPSQEHFENLLATAWNGLDPNRPVWLEDESRHIGSVQIPAGVWDQMQKAPIYVLDVPVSRRVKHLTAQYGAHPVEALKSATRRIQRRLGGLRTRQVLEALDSGNLKAACTLLLSYYDRTYRHALTRRAEQGIPLIDLPPPATPEAALDFLLSSPAPS